MKRLVLSSLAAAAALASCLHPLPAAAQGRDTICDPVYSTQCVRVSNTGQLSTTGSGGSGGGGAVTAAAGAYSAGALADGAEVTVGAVADAPWNLSGSATQIAISKKIALLLNGGIGVTGTVTANQGGAPWTQNETQLGGTAISLGSGATDGGTQRVVLGATEPALQLAAGANTIGNVGGLLTVGSAMTGGGLRVMGLNVAGNTAQDISLDAGGRVYVVLGATEPALQLAAGANTIGNVGGLLTVGSAMTGGGQRIMGLNVAGNTAQDIALDASGRVYVDLSASNNAVQGVETAGSAVTGGGFRQMLSDGTNAQDVKAISGVTNGVYTGVPAAGVLGFYGYADSNTALGASGTFTGTSRAAPVWARTFKCKAYADQAGTLTLLESDDAGSTFQVAATASITAGGVHALVKEDITGVPGTTQFECKVANSTTAESVLRLTSAFGNQ